MIQLVLQRSRLASGSAPRPVAAGSPESRRLARLARVLSWLTLGSLGLEAGVAIAAALIAGSVALLGFGLDSGSEAMASVIVIWRFTGSGLTGPNAERRAQQFVAVSFYLLGPYIAARPSWRCSTAIGPRPTSSAWC